MEPPADRTSDLAALFLVSLEHVLICNQLCGWPLGLSSAELFSGLLFRSLFCTAPEIENLALPAPLPQYPRLVEDFVQLADLVMSKAALKVENPQRLRPKPAQAAILRPVRITKTTGENNQFSLLGEELC